MPPPPLAAARGAHLGRQTPQTHTITYDQDSLMIDGRRTVIWSGEIEYWRLPSPSRGGTSSRR